MQVRGKLEHLQHADHAEPAVCLNVLRTAADLGISRVIVELDASALVSALNGIDGDLSSIVVLINTAR